jgi:hypothetical protein
MKVIKSSSSTSNNTNGIMLEWRGSKRGEKTPHYYYYLVKGIQHLLKYHNSILY